MPYLVLAYPKILNDDLEWMQFIRDEHDELYAKVVAPHFTLVFPVGVELGALIAHVRKVAMRCSAFPFILRCAVLEKDAFNEYTHVFLVPDEGYSDLVKLHDRLYTRVLESELRLDISFIPHIGIGNSVDAKTCKKLADQINLKDFAIKGIIDKLDIVLYEDNKVTTVERIDLADHFAPSSSTPSLNPLPNAGHQS
jgi:2'-5' RNA ligase superfamily